MDFSQPNCPRSPVSQDLHIIPAAGKVLWPSVSPVVTNRASSAFSGAGTQQMASRAAPWVGDVWWDQDKVWRDKKGRPLECGGGGAECASEHPDAKEHCSLCLDPGEDDAVSLCVMQKLK